MFFRTKKTLIHHFRIHLPLKRLVCKNAKNLNNKYIVTLNIQVKILILKSTDNIMIQKIMFKVEHTS